MNKTPKKRSEIDKKYKWDIEKMYPDEKLWNEDIKIALKEAEDFSKFKGKLANDGKTLLEALKARDFIWQKLEKAFVYARMRRDEDNTCEKYQALCNKVQNALSKASTLISFFIPELLSCDEKFIYGYIAENEELGTYKFMIECAFKEKEHILSEKEERLLAQLGEVTSATNDIFTMLNNADMDFGAVSAADGNSLPLTHGNYITYMEGHDRTLRKNAYERMYTSYKKLINTISTTYSYNAKRDVVTARLRRYPSAIEASLSGDNVPCEVYDNLIDVIHNSLPDLYRYMDLRKKILGVDTLNMYDVYVPLVRLPQKEISFEDAKLYMEKALAPLGDDYINNMKNGLAARWVDVYETPGKTSGAYSFGSYDSMPYILMNFSSTLKDVFTLVHEMGHSMHSFYTRNAQPYIYGDHSIFTAEVASTVNENLLIKHLYKTELSKEMQKYLLNYHIEEFRTTVFRQTMFAEFEKWSHETLEQGIPITAQSMCDYYGKLNKLYFGDAVCQDDFIKYEWARIPHFYNAFYVYKYATGYCAAAAISDKILSDGPEDYLKFLKTGSSNHPIELLKIAGVDMGKKEPIQKAMDVFKGLVDDLEKLV